MHQSSVDELDRIPSCSGLCDNQGAMQSVKIEDAQIRLSQLTMDLRLGEALIITQDGEPVATLTRTQVKTWPCKAGSAKSTPHWMAPDFNAT